MIFVLTQNLKFELPEQLKDLLGEECYEGRQSVSKRLKFLGVPSSYVSTKTRQLLEIKEFKEWYDAELQEKLRITSKERFLRFPNGESYKMPEQWRDCLGEEVLNGERSVSMCLKSKGFKPNHINRLIKDNFMKIPEFVAWYNPEVQLK